MSGFWARKLAEKRGQAAPVVRVPQTHPAAVEGPRPWWDQPVYNTPQNVVTPDQAVEYTPPKGAKSARLKDSCPECGSGNYMRPEGLNVWTRCFDCGYPLVQSGSGSGLPSDSTGPATPARQIHTGESYFNPRNIIGHIG